MRRGVERLSALAVKRLSKPGLYADGRGLYLRVAKNSSSRTFVFRYSLGGRRRVMGLGSTDDTSLSDVRDLARELRRHVRNGVDPITERRAKVPIKSTIEGDSVTFRVSAEAHIQQNRPGWKNAKHAEQWRATLERYAYPLIGDMDVAAISTADILRVLEPIWITRTETASRLRGRIELILSGAAVRGHRAGENPARWRGHLDNLLPRRSKVRKVSHHAALPFAELPAFMRALEAQTAISAALLRFTILTAARSTEAREATWAEIDLDARVWTVPADRIKASREHRVPLAPGAIGILKDVAALTGNQGVGYVFPSENPTKPLNVNTMLALLRRLSREDLTVHGFRSTFRDWAAEMTDFPSEVAEMALAHVVGNKVEAAYRRGDLFGKRRALMEAWDDFAHGHPPNPSAPEEAEKSQAEA